MSKAFSALAKFLHGCLTTACSKISIGMEGVCHYTMLKHSVRSLVESASDPKVWRNPKLMMKEYAASKNKHKRNLFPGLEKTIADSVKTWNTSSFKRRADPGSLADTQVDGRRDIHGRLQQVYTVHHVQHR